MTALVVVYHSVSGRTRALAEAVARGAESAGDGSVVAHLLDVEAATREQDVLAAADAIVFGSPTYMGSASAAFKTFMDATGAVWALQGWRDKLAAGFTHSAALSGDKLGTLTQLAVFAAQHGMVWVGLGLPPTYAAAERPEDDTNRLGSHLGAVAQSRPGGGTLPAGDLKTAEHLGRRVALAALRWKAGAPPEPLRDEASARRHPTTRTWAFPPPRAAGMPGGVERVNLRELVAREDRHEHHLIVCATVDGVQLEITTASEALSFAHVNLSDEYALPLPTGDELVDRFPLRTFLTDPSSGEDVGRYNHRIGDLVLHPHGLMHWPGRLRPPFEPFEFPAGMRRCGLSLVFCASVPTPPTPVTRPLPGGREEDAKPYATPAPRMTLATMHGEPGVLARIGRAELALVERPQAIAPPHGGWVVVLEATAGGDHAACDLLRVPEGASLDGTGIARALVLASSSLSPDAAPASWQAIPAPPFPPFEDATPGVLPLEVSGLRVEERTAASVRITIGDAAAEVPRHWLARMLFRVALHRLAMGYAETYGGFFADDRSGDLVLGLRGAAASVRIPRAQALEVVERLYRAVAPPSYRERAV